MTERIYFFVVVAFFFIRSSFILFIRRIEFRQITGLGKIEFSAHFIRWRTGRRSMSLFASSVLFSDRIGSLLIWLFILFAFDEWKCCYCPEMRDVSQCSHNSSICYCSEITKMEYKQCARRMQSSWQSINRSWSWMNGMNEWMNREWGEKNLHVNV